MQENVNFGFPSHEASSVEAPMNGAQSAPSAPVVIVVQQGSGSKSVRSEDKEHFRKMFPVKIVSALSAGQIFIFFVALICEIILIVNDRYPRDGVVGIWGGIFFGIAGCMGLLATWRPSQCSVIAFMVLNIVATCFCLPVVVLGGISIDNAKNYIRWASQDIVNDSKVNIIFYGIIFFCGFVESLVSVACAAIACRATCCRKQTSGSVIYHPNNVEAQAHGVVTIPLNSATAVQTPANPPKYEAVEAPEDISEVEKYQRFQ